MIKKFISSPIDSILNKKSKNAIENKAVAEAIEQIESDIARLEGLKASLSQYGSVKLSSATDVTDSTGLALPVTEKNPAVSGTIASEISSERNRVSKLFALKICNENIKDISEIFDYDKHELSLFSDWASSGIAPKNFSMVLRIPSLDSRNAFCLCLHGTMLWVGELNFIDRTIKWEEK